MARRCHSATAAVGWVNRIPCAWSTLISVVPRAGTLVCRIQTSPFPLVMQRKVWIIRNIHTLFQGVYLVARERLRSESVRLQAGDVPVVEPGESHTFLTNSPDYFHFVLQIPGFQGEAVQAEKRLIPRSDLGL
jgi:hypothetical protein